MGVLGHKQDAQLVVVLDDVEVVLLRLMAVEDARWTDCPAAALCGPVIEMEAAAVRAVWMRVLVLRRGQTSWSCAVASVASVA